MRVREIYIMYIFHINVRKIERDINFFFFVHPLHLFFLYFVGNKLREEVIDKNKSYGKRL